MAEGDRRFYKTDNFLASGLLVGAAVAREVVGLKRARKYEKAASWYKKHAEERDQEVAAMKEQFPLD